MEEMKMYMKRVWTVAVVVLMTLSAMGLVIGHEEDMDANSDNGPQPMAGSTPRTVLIEEFTATWCPPCNTVSPALSRMADEYEETELVMLAWHPSSSEIGSPVVSTRANYFGWYWLPTAVIDGGSTYTDDTLWRIGAGGGTAGSYGAYRTMIDAELAKPTNLKIDMWGSIEGGSANALARIEATDPVTQTDLYAHFVLYEDDLYSTNGEEPGRCPYWRHVVRDYSYQPFSISEGDIVYFEDSFAILPTWNPQRLGAAVFVQTDVISGNWTDGSSTYYNREVLQAAELDFIHDPILLVNDGPLFPNAWYMVDPSYQKLLAYNDYAFDTWDVLAPTDTNSIDIRPSPSFEEIKDYSTVIWLTSSETNTLDVDEMTALTSYLDSDGSLFITGSNIGSDLDTTDPTNLTNYLHTTFVADLSGDNQIQGIAGDPISDPWNATTIGISGSSADVIDPADVWTNVTFEYDPSGQSAALRSQHDADSRLVYFGFMYFDLESTTGPPNAMRVGVLKSIMNWLMPAPPVTNPPAASTITDAVLSADYKNVTITWNASADDGAGEDDVIRYNIYWGLKYSGPYYYLTSLPATKSLTYSWEHVNISTEPFTFFYKIYAEDATTQNASLEVAVKYYKPFSVGANLASIPIPPADTSLASVLQMISFEKVWAYDPTDPLDPWKSYVEAKPYKGDLTELNNTMGFWVEVLSDSSLIMAGLAPGCTDVPLYVGWNLVSYPSFTPRTVADALSAIPYERVEGFDPTKPPEYGRVLWDADIMEPGYGYWIKVSINTIWTVCN